MVSANRSEMSIRFQDRWAIRRSAGQLIPDYRDTDLTYYEDFLPFLVITEIEKESRRLPFRFVGSAIRDFAGRELTGTNYHDLFPDSKTDIIRERSHLLQEYSCGRYEHAVVDFKGGRHFSCDITILPMTDAKQNYIFLNYVEVTEELALLDPKKKLTKIEYPVDAVEYIDLGVGVPDYKLAV